MLSPKTPDDPQIRALWAGDGSCSILGERPHAAVLSPIALASPSSETRRKDSAVTRRLLILGTVLALVAMSMPLPTVVGAGTGDAHAAGNATDNQPDLGATVISYP